MNLLVELKRFEHGFGDVRGPPPFSGDWVNPQYSVMLGHSQSIQSTCSSRFNVCTMNIWV